MPYFAIVFNVDRGINEAPDARTFDMGGNIISRGQEWKKGDVYSTGSRVDAASLPTYFDVVELDAPPGDGETWDRDLRRFVKAVQSDAKPSKKKATHG